MGEDLLWRRESERKPVTIQLRVAFGDQGEFIERYATNISHGGVFIRTRDPRKVGSKVSFEFRLRNDELVFSGEGIVRWVQGMSAQGSGTPGMGVEFLELSESSKEVLNLILDGRGEARLPEPIAPACPDNWLPLDHFPAPEPTPPPQEPSPPPVMIPVISPHPRQQSVPPQSFVAAGSGEVSTRTAGSIAERDISSQSRGSQSGGKEGAGIEELSPEPEAGVASGVGETSGFPEAAEDGEPLQASEFSEPFGAAGFSRPSESSEAVMPSETSASSGFYRSSTSGASDSFRTSETSGNSDSLRASETSGASAVFISSGTSESSPFSVSSGISGASGASEFSGASGSSGASGASGSSGSSGSPGSPGSSGSSGSSGASGSSGSSGSSGATISSEASGSPEFSREPAFFRAPEPVPSSETGTGESAESSEPLTPARFSDVDEGPLRKKAGESSEALSSTEAFGSGALSNAENLAEKGEFPVFETPPSSDFSEAQKLSGALRLSEPPGPFQLSKVAENQAAGGIFETPEPAKSLKTARSPETWRRREALAEAESQAGWQQKVGDGHGAHFREKTLKGAPWNADSPGQDHGSGSTERRFRQLKREVRIGLDLGWSNIRIAVANKGIPRHVPLAGSEAMSSAVFASEDGPLIGKRAENRAKECREHERWIFGLSHLLGLRADSKAAKTWAKRTAETVVQSSEGVALELFGAVSKVENLLVALLLRARREAESHLGARIGASTLSLPSFFSPAQKEALQKAADLAGFSVEATLDASSAATLGCLGPSGKRDLLLLDLGGGAFSLAWIQQQGTQLRGCEQVDLPFLGGHELDQALMRELLAKHREEWGDDEPSLQPFRSRLLEECRHAKEALSYSLEHEVLIPSFIPVGFGKADLSMHLSRAKALRQLSPVWKPVVQAATRLLERIHASPRLANRQPPAIEEVLIVGGQSHSGALVGELFSALELPTRRFPFAAHAPALGAALMAQRLGSKSPARAGIDGGR